MKGRRERRSGTHGAMGEWIVIGGALEIIARKRKWRLLQGVSRREFGPMSGGSIFEGGDLGRLDLEAVASGAVWE